MRVLFIAPLPEPLTGHSLACKILKDELLRSHEMLVVDTNKLSLASGVGSASRIVEVLGLLGKVLWRVRRADVIYLTISESVAGNVKDLLTYLLCFPKIRKMVIHLHGGTIRKGVFDRHPVLRALNRFFISRMGAVVVLGESHRAIFEGLADDSRIRVVPNFAEDDLFASPDAIRAKFSRPGVLRILFLSHLIEGKGHEDIVEAYVRLRDEEKARVAVDFAGAFENDAYQQRFLTKAGSQKGLRYHGVVGGDARKRLLADAHLLCLPTGLSEGQPLSILEAYAAGCVVATTYCGGIPDVFADGTNGFRVTPSQPDSIKHVIESCLASPEALAPIALRNNAEACGRFTVAKYLRRLVDLLERVNTGIPLQAAH